MVKITDNKKENGTEQTQSDLFLGLVDDDSVVDYSYAAPGENDELILALNEDEDEEIEEYISVLVPDDLPDENEIPDKKAEKKAKAKNNNHANVKSTKEKKSKGENNKKKKEVKKDKPAKKDKKEKEPVIPAVEDDQSERKAPRVFVTLAVIIAVIGLLFAIAYYFIIPQIENYKLEQTEAMIGEIFGENISYKALSPTTEGVTSLYAVENETSPHPLGYCAVVSPKGKNGKINMMVGVGFSKNIVGIKVISHREDPTHGGGVLLGHYLSNYIGLWGDSIPFERDIDAVASATITSKAVNNGINCALAAYGEVFTEDIVKSMKKPGTISLEDAVYDYFGWIQDEHEIHSTGSETHPFNEMYALSVKSGDTQKYVGYIAQTSASVNGSTAELLIGIYYDTIIGVRVLDYEGSDFAGIARDSEYLNLFKTNREKPQDPEYGVTIPLYSEFNEEARIITEKTREALDYYGEFFDTYNQTVDSETKEVTTND